MCCGIMHGRVVGSYFCTEKNVTASVYLDMLQLFVFRKIVPLNKKVKVKQLFNLRVLQPTALHSYVKKCPVYQIS